MAVTRYYRADKNPEGATFPGVPLRDIETDEWESYPAWLQQSVDASEFYQVTNPHPQPRARREKDEEES